MTTSNVVVVDTNVWLDYLFGMRPGNKVAMHMLSQARRLDLSLVIPPHSLSTVFFLFQQELKARNRQDGKLAPEKAALSARRAAWAAVDLIMELATVGPCDQADALMATKHRTLHSDFEDNLVISCAMRTNARLLVTNDEKLLKHSPVATMNAEDAGKLFELE